MSQAVVGDAPGVACPSLANGNPFASTGNVAIGKPGQSLADVRSSKSTNGFFGSPVCFERGKTDFKKKAFAADSPVF